MSFQMTEPELKLSWFHLVESTDNSPTTGIKINTNVINYYDEQSTFRFTMTSKETSITNLVVSKEEKIEEDMQEGEESTYKEYTLTPSFDPEILNYETTILEYIDSVDITATKTYEKTKMKIKIPKRDEDRKSSL